MFTNLDRLGSGKVVSSAPNMNCCVTAAHVTRGLGVFLLFGRFGRFGRSLCGSFVSSVEGATGMSLCFRGCGQGIFRALVGRTGCGCAACVLVPNGFAGVTPLLRDLSNHIFFLSRFRPRLTKGCSSITRGFRGSACRTLMCKLPRLGGCRRVVVIRGRRGRPVRHCGKLYTFYRRCRFARRCASSIQGERVERKRAFVIIGSQSLISLLGRTRLRGFTPKGSFKVVSCGSAPLGRVLTKKVAALSASFGRVKRAVTSLVARGRVGAVRGP